MNLTAQEIVDYVTKTQPALLALVIKQAKPYMTAIEERCKQVEFGTISLTITVRAGEVEKMELDEKKTWLRPKPTA